MVTLNLSSNVIGGSIDGANFPHNLLLNDIKLSRFRKAFANGSSANITFSITQLSKTIKLGGIFGDLLAAIPQVIFKTG